MYLLLNLGDIYSIPALLLKTQGRIFKHISMLLLLFCRDIGISENQNFKHRKFKMLNGVSLIRFKGAQYLLKTQIHINSSTFTSIDIDTRN